MKQRLEIHVEGIVQGVGFRPFAANLAKREHLTGFVSNSSEGVEIEVEGEKKKTQAFLNDLKEKAPPLSVITKIISQEIPLVGDKNFTILQSNGHSKVTTLISPDTAVCKDCLEEMFDKDNRRYLYPFINCTNCGPRYTIIENIPYDRPYTSMKHFTMCKKCQAEYDSPDNRRYHAQPNACPDCGPHVELLDSMKNKVVSNDPVEATAELLKQGKIVAIKGLGGFHLAVDACNDDAVTLLRTRKGREEKPFAIMVNNIESAKNLAEISEEEELLLCSRQTPIVLLNTKLNNSLSKSLAPGNNRRGIMLPYTPLQYMLMSFAFKALVMTSANYSDEPICIDNNEAFQRLNNIADFFLVHNRDIYIRSDDSVVIHLANKTRQIRRSRGFIPQPIFVQSDGLTVLGTGGELKNTLCLLGRNQAIMSQHIGDLENIEAYNFFQSTAKHLERLFEAKPEVIAYDLHPGYLSTQWALEQQEVKLIGVQHHHAHLASCMAENNLSEPVIGLIMDGTGYGTDKTIWGGEVLIGDFKEFNRFACFEPMPLPGGDAAIKAPWRTAVSYLYKTYGNDLPEIPFLKLNDINSILQMVGNNINSPLTSSCGRLFDAVAAMCGGRQEIRYEGQAAIEFMQAAEHSSENILEFSIVDDKDLKRISVTTLVKSIVKELKAGKSFGEISTMFHATLVVLFTEVVLKAKKETGINTVVLSGGVFQNMFLLEGTITALKGKGFDVHAHSQVPANDGGISLGQTLIAREQLK
ncbi:MAG: carbamoyltransferase HypF [Nitrospinae bacterium]|nr:carbamoyltransferase HypF [Nitrospinota bacterium]